MWEPLGAAGDEYRLIIRATRVSMRQLVVIIVGCVAIGGTAAVALLITFTVETGTTLARSAVVTVSGGLGLVIVLVLLWIFSWRRKSYVVDWGVAGVRITGAGLDSVLPWRSIERILVRMDSDYARVELRRTDSPSVTLLAGFGSQDATKPRPIDEIPEGVIEILRRHQFVERMPPHRARGLRIFVPNFSA